MKSLHRLLALSFLLCATAAHAQLYKWVGPDGKVVYSDSPPPSNVKKVETKPIGGNEGGPPLPFDLAEAVRNSPVTLYSSAKCIPCDEGRRLLSSRGIPFHEKTVATNEDVARLRQVSSDGTLPLLLIGRSKQPGYEAGAWNAALTAAGYPESSKLPQGYRNPAPEAAAPAAAPVAAKTGGGEAQAEARPEALPAATGNAPPGFRF